MKNTEIILISNPKKSPIAEDVLLQNGFRIISNWALNGIYEKDDKQYNFAGWSGDEVKVKIIN